MTLRVLISFPLYCVHPQNMHSMGILNLSASQLPLSCWERDSASAPSLHLQNQIEAVSKCLLNNGWACNARNSRSISLLMASRPGVLKGFWAVLGSARKSCDLSSVSSMDTCRESGETRTTLFPPLCYSYVLCVSPTPSALELRIYFLNQGLRYCLPVMYIKSPKADILSHIP